MNRIKLFPVVFLIAIFLVSFPLPGEEEEKDLIYLKTFTKAYSLVEKNYVEKVDPQKLIYGAIRGMLSSLDPHSSFMTPDQYKEMKVETKGSFGGIGIEITVKNGILTIVSPIEGTPGYKAGLKPGDRIIKINGESTVGISLMQAVKKLRGPKGTKVTITILRKGVEKPFDVTIVRDIIKIKSVTPKLLGKIGYVRIRQFQETTDKELSKALKGWNGKIDGLILDLRNNPGGLLDEAVKVADMFIDEGTIVSIRGRGGKEQHVFTATKDMAIKKTIPMVILVNAGSASASEIVASCLQDHRRALIVGTRSFGKGSVQTIFPMEDGSALRLTTAKYYSPLGREIQAKGVIPDVQVEQLIIKKGKRKVIREAQLIERMKGISAIKKKEKPKKPTKEEIEIQKILSKDFQLKIAYSLLKGMIRLEEFPK